MKKSSTTLIYGITLVCAILIIAGIFLLFEASRNRVYETNDYKDYLNIVGNYDNDPPKAFVKSFFPEFIDKKFENVVYHYKAIKGDSYAYEVYLEFTIEDPLEYQTYLEMVTYGASIDCPVFSYDERYRDYTISNVFALTGIDGTREYISEANIGKLLFSVEQQKIMYIAFGVYDGGGTKLSELNYFFEMFNIDPQDFENEAYPAIPRAGRYWQ